MISLPSQRRHAYNGAERTRSLKSGRGATHKLALPSNAQGVLQLGLDLLRANFGLSGLHSFWEESGCIRALDGEHAVRTAVQALGGQW